MSFFLAKKMGDAFPIWSKPLMLMRTKNHKLHKAYEKIVIC